MILGKLLRERERESDYYLLINIFPKVMFHQIMLKKRKDHY